jgi:hypothetical protein
MSRWSGRRGQIEPLAAIVAVFAVGAGLTVYAGVLDGTLPDGDRQQVAGPTLDHLESSMGESGIVEPEVLPDAQTATAPEGYHLNATLETTESRWQTGPAPPQRAQQASERVSVRVEPGRVRPGRLTVQVWR